MIETTELKLCRAALEDMVWQFAEYWTNDGKTVLRTGGVKALKNAFEVLGWEDPKIIRTTGRREDETNQMS